MIDAHKTNQSKHVPADNSGDASPVLCAKPPGHLARRDTMKPLTEGQCTMLQKLMNRAIANGQLAIQFDSPNDDGNHCSSDEWRADLCEASYEDKPTQHEVILMIDDRSRCFLAGVTQD